MATSSTAGQVGSPKDLYRAGNFAVVIDNVMYASFVGCSSIKMEMPAICYREAGAGQIVRNLPGRTEYSTVTFTQGLTDSQDLYTWANNLLRGMDDKRTVSILQLKSDGITEAQRTILSNARIVSFCTPDYDAMKQGVAIESLTLSFESLERVVRREGA